MGEDPPAINLRRGITCVPQLNCMPGISREAFELIRIHQHFAAIAEPDSGWRRTEKYVHDDVLGELGVAASGEPLCGFAASAIGEQDYCEEQFQRPRRNHAHIDEIQRCDKAPAVTLEVPAYKGPHN